MLSLIGWILFLAMLVWHVTSLQRSHTKRRHLVNYAIYLLLEDSVLQDHRAKLSDWIHKANASNAAELGLGAQFVVENMAESLGQAGSTLGTTAMLWRSPAAKEARGE